MSKFVYEQVDFPSMCLVVIFSDHQARWSYSGIAVGPVCVLEGH